jgi:serine/threonine protein kinase
MPSKNLASYAIPDYTNYLLPIPENPLHFVELLGIGAFGKVYKAVSVPPHPDAILKSGCKSNPSQDLNSEVELESPKAYAVKCLLKPSPGTCEEEIYFSELRNHRCVSSHPNIVSLIDSVHSTDQRVSPAQDYGFVILELCDAGDLFDALNRHKFDRDDEAIKSVFLQILDAVEYCHQNSVFHRDLKPENVLLCTDGSVRLADFGLSTTNKWSERFHCGSASYMSPGKSILILSFRVFKS